MTDKEKIRAEIERQISSINNRENKIPADKVAVIQLEAVLSFIDSLQEEPDLNWKDMSLQEKKDLVAKLSEDIRKEEPTTSVWHDASETPKMYCKYLIRYADGRVNGSWERHDDGFIPWKDVVKEHKFTHWCYVEDLLKL